MPFANFGLARRRPPIRSNAETTTTASLGSLNEKPYFFQELNMTTKLDVESEFSLLIARYKGFGKAGAENVIRQYTILYEAKNDPSVDFKRFCAEVKLQDTSTIRKFLKIGEEADRLLAVVDRLPSEWTTLYGLAKLEPTLFDRLIVSGQIHPSVPAEEIRIATRAAGRSQANRAWVRLDLKDLEDDDRTLFVRELWTLVDRYGITLTGNGLPEQNKLVVSDQIVAACSPELNALGAL
jgi:hypothetical protein